MNVISMSNVTKRFTDQEKPAVNDLNLNIEEGEILTLLGPSGCGKTTTLRLAAGFERPDTGSIKLRERLVADEGVCQPPEKREIGMVFQDYALFPHLSVRENIIFGLNKKFSRTKIQEKLQEVLQLIGLSGYEDRRPEELSGGEQQRVSLARALAREPVVILLDEPFSNLDTKLREQMRRELKSIIKSSRSTAMFVTHDQKEALAISDRIAVMDSGKLQQLASPRQIYQYPHTKFVANFVGQTNLITGEMLEDGSQVSTKLGVFTCPHTHNVPPGSKVTLSLRPEGIEPDSNGEICAEVTDMIYQGETIEVHIRASNHYTDAADSPMDLIAHLHPEHRVQTGQKVNFKILPYFVAVIEE